MSFNHLVRPALGGSVWLALGGLPILGSIYSEPCLRLLRAITVRARLRMRDGVITASTATAALLQTGNETWPMMLMRANTGFCTGALVLVAFASTLDREIRLRFGVSMCERCNVKEGSSKG